MENHLWLVLSVYLLSAPPCGEERPPLPRGYVLFAADFEGRDALDGWSGQVALGEGCGGGKALFVERPAGSPSGSSVVTRPLPVEKMRGYLVHFSARVKAQDVSRKPNPWNGVKFMAPIETATGRSWPAAEMRTGTFGWQRDAFAARVPEDAKSISLCLGLEMVTGKAWFDNVRVTVARPPIVVKPRIAGGPVYKGHDAPRLRGAMVQPNISEESLRVFGQEWNANLIRWQLVRRGKIADPLDLAAYEQWLQSAPAQLDAALPLCEKYEYQIGVQNHYGGCVPVNAMGLHHLLKNYDPKFAGAIWDPAHTALEGEEMEPALDIVASHLCEVNLKNAFWNRVSGPESEAAEWSVYWTSGRQGRASWPRVAAKLKQMDYTGPVCFSAEYSAEKEVDRLIVEDLAYARACFGL